MQDTSHIQITDELSHSEEYVPRAFMVGETKKDVSSASSFGTLTRIFGSKAVVPSIWSAGFQTVLLNELRNIDFDPAIDFIVVSGEMVAVSVALAAIAAEYGGVSLLCYDARSRNYTKVTVGDETC